MLSAQAVVVPLIHVKLREGRASGAVDPLADAPPRLQRSGRLDHAASPPRSDLDESVREAIDAVRVRGCRGLRGDLGRRARTPANGSAGSPPDAGTNGTASIYPRSSDEAGPSISS